MGFYKLHKLKLPKLINIPLSIWLIHCYGIMTGMSASSFRAIVMFGLHIAAGLFGRTYDMLTAMSVAGILLLTGQPLYAWHSGFLFSFGAILAIGLLRPVVEEMLMGGTKLEKLMSTSLSISIVTLPVYLCFYYEYPIYSGFLNLIIIPGTSLIVSDGLLTCAAAACFLPLENRLRCLRIFYFRSMRFAVSLSCGFRGAKLTCLHPAAGEDTGDSNASSTVLYLEYDAFTALFTGDLEGEGEKAVKEQLKKYIKSFSNNGKRITVLKVAHHGSRNSTGEDFLDVISPQIAVISAGRDNRYGHPHDALLIRLEECGSRVFLTDTGGAVTVTYRNDRVNVECFCK